MSLLLPSVSAVKLIDKYISERDSSLIEKIFKNKDLSEKDCTIINDYAKEIHEGYKNLGGGPKETSDELVSLRIIIVDAFYWLYVTTKNVEPSKPTTEGKPTKLELIHRYRNPEKVNKADSRLTFDLLKLFFPEKVGEGKKYTPENVVGGYTVFEKEKRNGPLSLVVLRLSPPPSPTSIPLAYPEDEFI